MMMSFLSGLHEIVNLGDEEEEEEEKHLVKNH